MESVSKTQFIKCPQTHHWYDPLLAVINTVMARIRSTEWVTGRQAQFSQDLSDCEVSDVTQAALQLNRAGSQLSGVAIESYLRHPLGNPSRNYLVCGAFMNVMPEDVAAAVKQIRHNVQSHAELLSDSDAAPLYFVPVVINTGHGLVEARHIVWITVDFQSECIEYFDPKGVSMKGTEAERMYTAVCDVFQKGDAPLIQNRVRIQYDAHNCGAFGLAYAEARIQGNSMLEFLEGWGDRNIEDERQAMANHMKTQALGKVPEPPNRAIIVDHDAFEEL